MGGERERGADGVTYERCSKQKTNTQTDATG